MFHKIKIVFLFLTLTLFVDSCYRDPFNVDLSEFEGNIVVEAIISDQTGPQRIIISRTSDNEESFPPVENAEVVISDDSGNSFQFYEAWSGYYQSYAFRGIPETTYKLKIVSKNETYEATSKMPQPITLDSLKFTVLECGCRQLHCSFRDRPEIKDYCFINLYHNGNLIDKYLYKDNMFNGQEVVLNIFHFSLHPNELVAVEVVTFDEKAYEFYHSVDTIDENDNGDELAGSFIPVTTYNPTSNFNKGALGYFSVESIKRYTMRITN